MAPPRTAPFPQVEPVLIRYSDMEPQEQTWLWPEVVPDGCLTLVFGDSGTGKSLLAADLAARVTRGLPWPADPDSAAPRGSVLLLAPQDNARKTVRPRLLAAGADLGRVTELQAVTTDGGDTRPFSLPGDLPALERAIADISDLRLVIVDSLDACVSGGARSGAFQAALAGLQALADRTDAAVVALTRPHAKTPRVSASRAQSDLAAVAVARSVWTLARGKVDRAQVYLMPEKCNFAAPTCGLVFTIPRPTDGTPLRLAWDDEPVAQLNGKPLQERSSLHRVFEACNRELWLRGILAPGPVPAAEVEARAERDRFSARELEDAKRRCGVVERQDEPGGPVLWALPPLQPPAPAQDGQEAEGAESTAFSRREKAPVGPEADGRMRGQQPEADSETEGVAPAPAGRRPVEAPSPASLQGAPSPDGRGQDAAQPGATQAPLCRQDACTTMERPCSDGGSALEAVAPSLEAPPRANRTGDSPDPCRPGDRMYIHPVHPAPRAD